MAQIFHPRANSIARISLLGVVVVLTGGVAVWAALFHSAYSTRMTVPIEQPVPFSHKHHVSGLGIDCRYCHATVEESSFADIPPVETCMSCHSQIWTNAPVLEPVRRSFQTGQPLKWLRVHDLPDFVYFDHSIHVNKGIGCATCHGQVDNMPLTWQTNTLFMQWCLDCHRNPELYVRPKSEVFNMTWQAGDQLALGQELVHKYNIKRRTDCITCHR
jgi:hypothetical protein